MFRYLYKYWNIKSIFYLTGLTEGIKIDDSPRKDNSANSALEQEMLMSRKQNGGSTGMITSFSAKKGFTLSQENLTNSSQDVKTTDFSSAKVTDNNSSHHHFNQEVSADAEIFLAAASSKSAVGGVSSSSRHKHESSLLSQHQSSAISTPVQHQVMLGFFGRLESI